jgi:arylsulfatase A-like enzyme
MAEPPNILFVTTDHWMGSLLGSAGHPAIITPTLDSLASDGIRFTNAYSECPVCVPARRTLMTGIAPEHHEVIDNRFVPFGEERKLAECFSDAGYQCYAVGKLHVTPQRSRIGFHDVLLDEEGRGMHGAVQDDYELFLGDNGFPGQRYAGGMSNNEYVFRPWHLDERLHVTNWATQAMARTIRRRDPDRPGFWYLSYSHPHPALEPLQAYLDLYRDVAISEPVYGAWVARRRPTEAETRAIAAIRRAFYALCTHIDHQLRVVIGTLREEGILDDTVILFTSDHGDMLGDHGMWAKRTFYEQSACVPMILSAPRSMGLANGSINDRLVGLADVMPTLLGIAGIPVPDTVNGTSMLGDTPRESLFGICGSGAGANAMIRTQDRKVIYYPGSNVVQCFDPDDDPLETRDLAVEPGAAQAELQALVARFGEVRPGWVDGDSLVGDPSLGEHGALGDEFHLGRPTNRSLVGQRGLQWPPRWGG